MGRIHFELGLLDRPLLIGLVLAVFSDHPADIIGMALALELLWLDIFATGTVIPPNRLLPLLLTVLTGYVFGLHGAARLFIPLCFFVPTAHLASVLAIWVRKKQNVCHALLREWANRGAAKDLPALLLMRGTIIFFVSHALLFIFLFICVLLFAWLWHWYLPAASYPQDFPELLWPDLSWPWLCLSAGVGGFLSLRLKKARFFFACIFALSVCGLLIFVI